MAALARGTHRNPSRRGGRSHKIKGTTSKSGSPMSFRMDLETRALVDRAATVVGQNRTDFMNTILRERATEILLNQRLFVLNDANWSAFAKRLDNPPPPNAKLKALLARVPIWDRQ